LEFCVVTPIGTFRVGSNEIAAPASLKTSFQNLHNLLHNIKQAFAVLDVYPKPKNTGLFNAYLVSRDIGPLTKLLRYRSAAFRITKPLDLVNVQGVKEEKAALVDSEYPLAALRNDAQLVLKLPLLPVFITLLPLRRMPLAALWIKLRRADGSNLPT